MRPGWSSSARWLRLLLPHEIPGEFAGCCSRVGRMRPELGAGAGVPRGPGGSGVEPIRRDDQGFGEELGEMGGSFEERCDAFGVLDDVLGHPVGGGEVGMVLGASVNADDVPAQVGDIEADRDRRVAADVRQLVLGCLAVDEDGLVIAKKKPDGHAVRSPVRTHRRKHAIKLLCRRPSTCERRSSGRCAVSFIDFSRAGAGPPRAL